MIATTADRVSAQTAPATNESIRRQTQANVDAPDDVCGIELILP